MNKNGISASAIVAIIIGIFFMLNILGFMLGCIDGTKSTVEEVSKTFRGCE